MARRSRRNRSSAGTRWRYGAHAWLLGAIVAGAVWADCPPAPEVVARLDALPLTQASRTARFGLPVPRDLFAEAIARPGTPIPSRDGKIIQGVMLVAVPIEIWWQVVNDDDHHAEDGYLPLRHSEVIAGIPGRSGRTTFQYYKSWGLGRWWVNRLQANESLYRASEGALWELHWRDVMADYPGELPPVEIDSNVPPIEEDWGAWLLVSLGESCTLVEYVASGEPGGLVGVLQWMALTRTLKTTFRGMVAMVEEHLAAPHARPVFHRPDGTPIEPRD